MQFDDLALVANTRWLARDEKYVSGSASEGVLNELSEGGEHGEWAAALL